MGIYHKKEYMDYIESHKRIMRKRYELCTNVMEQLLSYDEEAYQYAYYLCGLNLEELNYMRYLFGSGIDTFFECKMFMVQKKYREAMDQQYWKQRYNRDSCNICIYVSRDVRQIAKKLVIPKVFEQVMDELDVLSDELILLAEAYPEFKMSQRWCFWKA